MAVVIHEFEVEVPPERQADVTPAASLPPASQPSVHEIERMVRRQMERCARVWAH